MSAFFYTLFWSIPFIEKRKIQFEPIILHKIQNCMGTSTKSKKQVLNYFTAKVSGPLNCKKSLKPITLWQYDKLSVFLIPVNINCSFTLHLSLIYFVTAMHLSLSIQLLPLELQEHQFKT